MTRAPQVISPTLTVAFMSQFPSSRLSSHLKVPPLKLPPRPLHRPILQRVPIRLQPHHPPIHQLHLIRKHRPSLHHHPHLIPLHNNHKRIFRIPHHHPLEPHLPHIPTPHHLDLRAVEIRTRQQTPLPVHPDFSLLPAWCGLPIAGVPQDLEHVPVPEFMQALVDVVADFLFSEVVDLEVAFLFGGEGFGLLLAEVVALFVGADVAAEGAVVGVGGRGVEVQGFVLDLVGVDARGGCGGVGACQEGMRGVGWGCWRCLGWCGCHDGAGGLDCVVRESG